MHLELDGAGAKYEQLARALKQAIATGRIPPGTKLPSTRALSQELGLARNTVVRAYELLGLERLGVAREGAGTYVAESTVTPVRTVAAERVPPQSAYAARLRELPAVTLSRGPSGARYDFQYGAPLLDTKLVTAWSTAVGAAAARASTSYPHPQGSAPLRESICRFLALRRGVVANAQDIVIVSGAQQALSLLARVLLDAGDVAAIEEPHYQLAANCLRAHGADVVGVRTDEDGLVVGELPSSARLVHVTPSHQFPSGSLMSLGRRRELLQFAGDNASWIVEDDYDGELSHVANPLPALSSLDGADRVIYVGTFSKILFPALRLGYVVCPKGLRKDLVAAKAMDDLGCPAIEQDALQALFERGAIDRHLVRSIAELRRRRVALLEGLERHSARHVRVARADFGMHVVAWLPRFDQARLDRLIATGLARGLGLQSIHSHYARPPRMPGLMLGFAGMFPRQIEAGMKLLGQCFEELEREAVQVS